METYIVTMGMTPKGLEEIDRIPGFVAALGDNLKKRKGSLRGFYKTMGEIDYVALFEAQNDQDALGCVMALGKSGYFTTTTLKAYSMTEMAESLKIFEKDFK